MHTVDLLEEAILLAKREGFSVRRQWLGETAGGPCRIGTQKVLFINLSLTAEEQLHQAVQGLRSIRLDTDQATLSSTLRRLLS
jgi:hypothetical protein